MDMSSLVLSLFLILPLFLAGWWVQERQQDAGWVDVLWAFCVVAVAVFYVIAGNGDVRLRWLTGGIYLLWFGRLGLHLTIRLLESNEEDGRYARMRQWAGKKSSVVFLGFYLMQASWVWIFTLPAWLLAAGRWPPLWYVSAALLVVAVAWWGESVADAQLLDFKRNPSNQQQVCRQGLWRYSRHPNYFFEWCHWFCYPLLGIASYGGGWLWVAPLVMFLFLYFVTGIPFSEQQALSRRGEAYRHHQQTTSMFIPWKPKS